MALETIKDARRLAARGGMMVLGAVVALACPACASKEKVASGPAGGMDMGSMSPPPMTAAYDPARQVASGSPSNPWASSAAGMPTASPNGGGSSVGR
jgi:hypothetical protein